MPQINQNESISGRREVPVMLNDSAGDPITGENGKGLISKPGSSTWTTSANNIVDLGSGKGGYRLTLSQGECDTPGTLMYTYDGGGSLILMYWVDIIPSNDLRTLSLKTLRKANRIEQRLSNQQQAAERDIDPQELL